MKIQKKKYFFFWGGGWSGRGGRFGGQGRCEQRSKFFVKIQNKKKLGRRVRSGGVRGGSQGGCEQRIEVFVKIHKKNRGGGWSGVGSGVRVDVNEELKFL